MLYDQITDHWILTQFTTRGLDAQVPCYNCVAISKTGDATGAYYRYAFTTQPDLVDGGYFFPDYPKYGVWIELVHHDHARLRVRSTGTASASTRSRRTRW